MKFCVNHPHKAIPSYETECDQCKRDEDRRHAIKFQASAASSLYVPQAIEIAVDIASSFADTSSPAPDFSGGGGDFSGGGASGSW